DEARRGQGKDQAGAAEQAELKSTFSTLSRQRDILLFLLPLRAGLVEHAEEWPSWRLWRSRSNTDPAWLHPLQVRRHSNWISWVKQPQTDAELEELRRSVNRGTSYG